MHDLLFFATILLAVLAQSVAGFGSALVAMSILTPLLGIQIAVPLVALFTLVLEIVLLFYYREAFNIHAIWRVILGSIIGIPLGVLFLKQVDERITLPLLGLIIAGYAVYALLRFELPELRHPTLGYIFGFFAGMLGGAYNTSGPPVIIYGDCRRWTPAEFKSNLQGFFLVNSFLVALSHSVGGNLNQAVWRNFLFTLPAMGIGLLIGLSLDRHMNPSVFRNIVLGLLIILGVRLIF